MNKYLTILLLLLSLNSFSQLFWEWGVGGEGVYNVTINGIGFGARAHLHLTDRVVLAPEASYFPGFNQVHEFYAGLNLNFNLTPYSVWGLYLTGGGFYNHWMNWESSGMSNAQLTNYTGEGGLGIVKNAGCFRPFTEYRIDSKWLESNFRIGFLVYFNDCGNHGVCPAYQ